MLQAILGIIPGVMKLADKMIVDKDKKAEFAFKQQEMQNALVMKLVEQETIPWVDATVKLLGAMVMLGRPVGSFALTAFYLWSQYRGVDLGTVGEAVTAGAFPAWMAAREAGKSRAAKLKEKSILAEKVPFLDEDY